MKKTVSLLLSLLLLFSLTAVGASAASSGFEIEDGVLLRYTGSEKSVSVPQDVYAVGEGAFENNEAIESLFLPDSVIGIGDRAFSGCRNLLTVSGGENVSSVGAAAFEGTRYFDESSDEFLILGKVLLWYNGSSSTVNLPEGIVMIAPYAFLRCDTLLSFFAGDSLSFISEGAFYECAKLSVVQVTASVKNVGAYAFEGTPFLDNGGEFVTLGDGVLIGSHTENADVSVPDSVRVIAPRVFYRNTGMTSLQIPSSVHTIGKQAFAECSSLSVVSLNPGLVSIGEEAFLSCFKLRSLSTPYTLSYIGKGAFLGCSGLKELSLCGSSLYLSYGAFALCTSLKLVLMSSDVSLVYDKAFYQDTALEAVSVSPETLKISPASFEGCPKFLLSTAENAFAASALSRIAAVDTVKGDADRDKKLSVLDATKIQKNMASLLTLDPSGKAAADIDFDGCVSVLDAMRVQKILARIISAG